MNLKQMLERLQFLEKNPTQIKGLELVKMLQLCLSYISDLRHRSGIEPMEPTKIHMADMRNWNSPPEEV